MMKNKGGGHMKFRVYLKPELSYAQSMHMIERKGGYDT